MCERIWYFRVCFPSDTEQNTTMSKPSVRQNRTKKPQKNNKQRVQFGRGLRKRFSLLFGFSISRYLLLRLFQERKKKKRENRGKTKPTLEQRREPDAASAGFLSAGTRSKAAPLFLP